MDQSNRNNLIDANELFLEMATNLEKVWRASLSAYTERELLDIFPEARALIPKAIGEWQDRRDALSMVIRKKLNIIKENSDDPFEHWFWREWIKVTDGEKLLLLSNHIQRLRNLIASPTKIPNGLLSQQEIDKAKAIPIEKILSQNLRKSSKNFITHCPIHKEKTPSFYIYPATNSFYCFACLEGGSTINLVMLVHGLSFPDTVRWLLEHYYL